MSLLLWEGVPTPDFVARIGGRTVEARMPLLLWEGVPTPDFVSRQGGLSHIFTLLPAATGQASRLLAEPQSGARVTNRKSYSST